MLQTSFLLMKSLNKNRESHFLICSVFFVSKGNFFDVYYSTDRFKAVVPVLVVLFDALWFILRGDLLMSYLVCSCVFQSF